MNRNSAMIWYPRIKELGILTPETIFIKYDHRRLVSGMEYGVDISESLNLTVEGIKTAAEKIGYPIFLRTDLGSAKHSGPSAYFIDSMDDKKIRKVLFGLVEDQEMKFWLEKEGPLYLMIRKFIESDYSFTAFGGLPIAREWRFFADTNDVHCYHPYWPEDAIKDCVDGWQNLLKEHHVEPKNINGLKEIAVKAAKVCGGEWSVDFAMDKYGQWWLIDMATKQDSWHWQGCVEAKNVCAPSD